MYSPGVHRVCRTRSCFQHLNVSKNVSIDTGILSHLPFLSCLFINPFFAFNVILSQNTLMLNRNLAKLHFCFTKGFTFFFFIKLGNPFMLLLVFSNLYSYNHRTFGWSLKQLDCLLHVCFNLSSIFFLYIFKICIFYLGSNPVPPLCDTITLPSCKYVLWTCSIFIFLGKIKVLFH